jgi:hypothetical protein
MPTIPKETNTKTPKLPISVAEELDTEDNPPIPAKLANKPKQPQIPLVTKKKSVSPPILLGSKSNKTATLPETKNLSLRDTLLKDKVPANETQDGSAKSIAEQDVYEKLGTLDDTVEMDSKEFDNLDDLVFVQPTTKSKKRTTNFKIKGPKT